MTRCDKCEPKRFLRAVPGKAGVLITEETRCGECDRFLFAESVFVDYPFLAAVLEGQP